MLSLYLYVFIIIVMNNIYNLILPFFCLIVKYLVKYLQKKSKLFFLAWKSPLKYSIMLLYHIIFKFKDLIFSRAKKGTLPRGNAARSKITDFRTALYPRQYHPSVLKNSFLSYFSLTRCFSAAHVSGKTEMRRERRKNRIWGLLTDCKYNIRNA